MGQRSYIWSQAQIGTISDLLVDYMPESCGDELRAVRQLVDHICDGLPVHGVEGRVDLVEEVERRRVALLDGEDEGQRHQGFLPAGELSRN